LIALATHQKVGGYINGVLNGSIVVCDLVRCAVQRHVNDLDKQSTQGFPYHFDSHHAAAAVDFFPMMLRHSIGEFAGRPFELEPWQAFAIWCIFGWKRDDDNSRRFRDVFWSMARKNGKSSIAAGFAILLAMMDINPNTGEPESVAEVVLSATKKEQVEKVIYAEIERMRMQSPEIKAMSSRENRQITFKHNKGSIRCVGSDKPFDGLNPHSVIKDEIHAWREHHRKFYDTMKTGGGSRVQPLNATVTTAGDDQSHLWKEEYDYAAGVVRGTIRDDQVFAFIFELDENDDPLDEANWIKANPNLGVSVRLEFLRQQAREASQKRIALNRFVRYHGNRAVTSTEKAFDITKWDACRGQLSDWSTADAIAAGCDLGSRDDMAAYALCARFPIGELDGNPVYRYEIDTAAYMSADTSRDLAKQPWANWVYTDLIKCRQYAVLALRDDLIAECRELGASQCAYDPYNAQALSEELTKEGMQAIRMAQNCTMFNEPIRDLMQCITDGRLRHDGNPLLRWCVNNAVISRDRNDRWMYDKRSSGEKIDPIVAVTMAFRMCSLAPSRPTGLLFVC
jgi:phage terminase large subunit-like protein